MGEAIQPDSSPLRSLIHSSLSLLLLLLLLLLLDVVDVVFCCFSLMRLMVSWMTLCAGLLCCWMWLGLDVDLKCWIQFFCFSISSLLEMRVFSGLAGSSGLFAGFTMLISTLFCQFHSIFFYLIHFIPFFSIFFYLIHFIPFFSILFHFFLFNSFYSILFHFIPFFSI